MNATENPLVRTQSLPFSYASLASVAQFVAKYPPFADYGLALMLSKLTDQLTHRSNVLVVKGNRLVAYAGWVLVRDADARVWTEQGGELPQADWENGDAVIVTITVTEQASQLRTLLKGISHRCAGRKVYRLRTFEDGRYMRRPPITGRAQATGSPLPATHQASADRKHQDLLNSWLGDLYSRASGKPTRLSLPATVISDPEQAQYVLRNPERFRKNYNFLEQLSLGRFSANHEDWKQRAALTQGFYGRSGAAMDQGEIDALYEKELLAWDPASGVELFDVMASAALGVASRAFGQTSSIPWPREQIQQLRVALNAAQAEDWMPLDKAFREANQAELVRIRQAIFESWQDSDAARNVLATFAESGRHIKDFDSGGELLQNLVAATETTASVLLWAVDCLSRYPRLRDSLQNSLQSSQQSRQSTDQLELFLAEVLRLFPPVPFVTRVATEDIEAAGLILQKDEVVVISIVGLHCHPEHWSDPMDFRFPRREFQAEAYNRNAYIPFLTGPRVCGGMKLAKKELLAGLRTVLTHFTVAPATGPVAARYGMTSRPGISPRLLRRSP